MLWIAFSVLAAGFQTIRTALQKDLKSKLSDSAVNWVRYAFGLPFVLIALISAMAITKTPLPDIPLEFWGYCAIVALTQVLATAALLALFGRRNFASGIALVRSEALFSAIFGMLFFAESLSAFALASISVGVAGLLILTIAKAPGALRFKLDSPSLWLGLASGIAFANASVFARSAALSLDTQFIVAASFSLLIVIIMQVFGLGLWLSLREPSVFAKIKANSRSATRVGLTSAAGSLCWFAAFALANAAFVKTVGQIEMLFAIIISIFIFKERIGKLEITGMLLIIVSVVMIAQASRT